MRCGPRRSRPAPSDDPPPSACKAPPYKKKQDFPDRQFYPAVLFMPTLLATGRQAFCFVPWQVVGIRVLPARSRQGTLWRAAGRLIGRWRKLLPPGRDKRGNRFEPPAVALWESAPFHGRGTTPCDRAHRLNSRRRFTGGSHADAPGSRQAHAGDALGLPGQPPRQFAAGFGLRRGSRLPKRLPASRTAH